MPLRTHLEYLRASMMGWFQPEEIMLEACDPLVKWNKHGM